MTLPLHTLGEHIQLLQKHSLLAAPAAPIPYPERPVALVSCDSQNVVPDTLFLCKGAHFKEQYLRDAIAKGALAYVAERPYPGALAPCVQVTDIRRAMALLADSYYGHPSGALTVVGITGTKGKTTTAYYLKDILDEWRRGRGQGNTAILSTLITDDGVERRPAKLTTPEPLDLERHLRNALTAGTDYVTMEVSSQALKYHRVTHVEFAVGIFLNIGEDHISPVEHPDFEDYFSSKLRLFDQCRAAVVNLDCDHAQRVRKAAQVCPRVMTFSLRDPSADVYAENLRKEGNATLFQVRTPDWTGELRLPMPGLFNVENALAAVAAAQLLGADEGAVRSALACAAVPGRMETYHSDLGGLTAIVDYAHNGMSLETLLSSARKEYPGRRLTVVFGCTGGKGLDRREGMAHAAGRWADRIILTEDDPGEESVEDICVDVARYLPAGKNWEMIPDRREAICQAILTNEAPTVVVVAGKGAETCQKRGRTSAAYPTDAVYVKQYLREFNERYGREKIQGFLEILPALRRWAGKTLVVEGGAFLQDAAALQAMGARVVVVSGAGETLLPRFAALGMRAVAVTGGESAPVDKVSLEALLAGGLTPLLSPASGADAAVALGADALFCLWNGETPMQEAFPAQVDLEQGRALLEGGALAAEPAGLLDACLRAVERGVGRAVLLDGAVEHALLLEAVSRHPLGITMIKE